MRLVVNSWPYSSCCLRRKHKLLIKRKGRLQPLGRCPRRNDIMLRTLYCVLYVPRNSCARIRYKDRYWHLNVQGLCLSYNDRFRSESIRCSATSFDLITLVLQITPRRGWWQQLGTKHLRFMSTKFNEDRLNYVQQSNIKSVDSWWLALSVWADDVGTLRVSSTFNI